MILQPGTVVKSIDNQELEIIEFIGVGGFGEVFKAVDKLTDEKYAIKILRNPFDDKLLKSFLNEGKLAIDIENDNVIKYIFFNDGTDFIELPPYIVMEYANGGTLRDVIDSYKNDGVFISNSDLSSLFSHLISGIKSINEKLIHRDIKPENILLLDDIIKISDFGISKVVEDATRTSTFKGFGCLPYISPEAWALKSNTIKMDIYSMGIVFYELTCLTHPLKVENNDIEEWKNAHLYQSVKPPNSINNSISSIVDRTIIKMLEKDITKRFNNWEEILAELSKEEGQDTPDAHFIERAIKRRTKRITEAEMVILEMRKRQKEKEEFLNIIKYQLENDIFVPLSKFVEKFNQTSENESNIDISIDLRNTSLIINFPNGNRINILVEPIFEENFHRNIPIKDFGRTISVERIVVPEYNHCKLMAWGIIEANDGKGMNLLLVDKKDSLYGYWVSLVNTNSALVRNPRTPEPFPFRMNEIEKELHAINAMHIYNTKHQVLDINLLKEFISEYY